MRSLDVAVELPADSHRWNRAMLGAFKKGMVAQQNGIALAACPYLDRRKTNGRLSWSRAFIAAWRDGWCWAAKRLPFKDMSEVSR